MSTLAWDGAVMAADNGGWLGGVVTRSLKIQPIVVDSKPFILAQCGCQEWSEQAKLYLTEGGDRPDPKEYETAMGNVWAIASDADGECWRITATFRWCKIYDPFTSLGAGQDVALGALAAGATAIKAVSIAEMYTDYAKFGVTAFRFGADGQIELA